MPVEMEDKFSVDDAPNEEGSEQEIDPKAHAKLIDGINNLTGSHFIRAVTRTEPSLKRSEFGLAKTKDDKVRLGDLVKLFTKSKKHTSVVKQLDKLKKRQPLAQPLEKPVADRIERKAGFERVQKDLNRWQAVVTATKVAPQTVYPLLYGTTTVHDAPPKKLSEYRVKTKLMEELEGLEKEFAGPEGDGDNEGESSDDNKQNYELTLEEMREKQRERARQKIRESYEIAKGRRMNKIKSKKYHRLLKKDKLKEQMKKFEELKEKNPEEALRQLDHIEKQRFQERVSLRHKNTGTWAKNLQIRAKYDMEVRRELAEQLAIGRELTAKRMNQGDSSSESDGEMELPMSGKSGANPWTESAGDHEQLANKEMKLSSGYRKYWEERNQIEQIKKQLANGADEEMDGKHPELNQDIEDEDHSGDEVQQLEEGRTETVKKSKLKGVKKGIKKSKRKIVMASGSWEVEDVDEEQMEKSKKPILKKKAKKRKDNVASVEQMFQEAEELIQDVLSNKLERTMCDVQVDRGENEFTKDSQTSEEREDKSTDLSFKQKASLAEADVQMNETIQKGASDKMDTVKVTHISDGSSTAPTTKALAEINLKQVVQMKPKHLLTALPNTIISGELSEDEDANDAHRLTIAEAFEDDDIVADFAKEKQDERQKDIPQEIELTLPGWGHWAGAGIQPRAQRPNARKLFKPPPALPRRDDNRDQVIINEDGLKNEKLGKHLVNEVPFPFLTVKDYEASLRAPLGRTFIPETAHGAMVQPRIVTKQGAVIEPMKKELLVENPSRLTRVGKRQQNEAVDTYNEYVKKNQRRAFGL
ncbi:U3 small nucleolar RNA-associated protein 14 homolog A [Anopheles maculipalpis]|uniref:U3 small nucleolar RNA-associated protein 14 homolog A n=1 Tax=Anopheles maculipalpis TaxID=1496333 RepID=UPI0021595B2B|nr:U3 small nucleolar RNA-associated protein 14 homolog A [Anopheles maculipalpis]